LTRLESGGETSFNEPFDLHDVISDATLVYRNEAVRRGLNFKIDIDRAPKIVIGDGKKIRTVIANLTANARTHQPPPPSYDTYAYVSVKFTRNGTIAVECRAFEEPEGLRNVNNIAVEIVVSDTGCGIPSDKLESIFREFEQVEAAPPVPTNPVKGLGTFY
jgi:signal transduction histidine kinase